jgi:hypothetical protein
MSLWQKKSSTLHSHELRVPAVHGATKAGVAGAGGDVWGAVYQEASVIRFPGYLTMAMKDSLVSEMRLEDSTLHS